MSAVLETPVTFVESLAELRFPPKTDERLQRLMDRNTEGQLSPAEREELEALVELSERMALLRAQRCDCSGGVRGEPVVGGNLPRGAQSAGDRCEYCRIHQALQGGTFHVEHIVPRCQDGLDSTDNLALSCPGCNLQKAMRTSAPDPATGAVVPLFNPRTDSWPEHLAWEGYRIHGRTPKGRALVAALDLNHTAPAPHPSGGRAF